MNAQKFVFIAVFFFSGLASARAAEPLSWQDCLAEAAQNNPQLISASEAVKQKKSGLDIASSSLYPQLSGQLGASRAKASGAESDSYSYGLSGSQLFFDGFKAFHEVSAAKEDVKAAQESFRSVSAGVRYSLRSAFIDLLAAQELVAVAEEIVKIRRDSLELISLRYYSGLEHKGALLTAEANLEAAMFELSRAQREVLTAQQSLSGAMGRTQFVPLAVTGDFLVREDASGSPDFQLLARSHPSVLQAAAQKNAAAFGIQSARAGFTPQVSGSAAIGKSSPDWPPESERWSMGVSVDVPVFEGGLKTAQLQRARAYYNQAEADERSSFDAAVVTLAQYWASLQDGLENVRVQEKSLKAGEERVQIAEAQYSTGFISFDTWIIIQNELVNAKNAYLAARAQAVRAEAQWARAKGETVDYAH